MVLQPRRHTVRARQRSRTSLPAFSRDLRPRLEEVGIDRLQFTVAGTWRTSGVGGDITTADDYKELLASLPGEVDWFRSPQNNRTNVRLQMRANSLSTLSAVDVDVNGWPQRAGTIRVGVQANPTRTLAHLLAEYGDEAAFVDLIAHLPPAMFFAISSQHIPRAFGSPDNWLPDIDAAHRLIGSDPFAVYLPIFVAKVQELVSDLIAPHDSTRRAADGTDIVLAEPGIEVRMHWGNMRVPQAEAYFERHHVGAVAAVKSAATVALASLDRTMVARYEPQNSIWVEREDDCLTFGAALAKHHRFLVYAKAQRRIRFEIKRLGKGNHTGLPVAMAPIDRLLAILDKERMNLLSICRWPSIGAMFDEPDLPSIADLTRMCSLIAEACSAEGISVEPVMTRLLEDGGIGRSGREGIPESVVQRLCASGLLDRTCCRNRDIPQPMQRVSLTPVYRSLLDAIGLTLAGSEVDLSETDA
jgi:hypothetical protein